MADEISTFEGTIFNLAVLGWFHKGCRSIELAAEGSLIDFELKHFLVGVDKMLILVLIFESILKWETFDIFAIINLIFDLGKDVGYFFDVWPEIGLYFGEDEHAIDSNFEGTMSWEGNNLIGTFIKVSV